MKKTVTKQFAIQARSSRFFSPMVKRALTTIPKIRIGSDASCSHFKVPVNRQIRAKTMNVWASNIGVFLKLQWLYR